VSKFTAKWSLRVMPACGDRVSPGARVGTGVGAGGLKRKDFTSGINRVSDDYLNTLVTMHI
jgi:ribosomal protein L11